MKRAGTDPDRGFFPTIASPISAGEPLACTGIRRMSRSRIDQHRMVLAAYALTCLATMWPCESIAGREIAAHRPVSEQPGTTWDEPAGKAGPTTPGQLFMLWSSFTDTGYTTGVAVSDSGKVAGPWRHQPEPLFRKDGGHAMMFRAFDGALVVSLHSPNRSPDERCQLFEVEDTGDTLRIVRTR